MRRSLHPTARKGRETKWEMMRLWGEESRKLKAGGRGEVKRGQAMLFKAMQCTHSDMRYSQEKHFLRM